MPDRAEQDGEADFKRLWREHGGHQYGPRTEHVNMEEVKFAGFCRALIALAAPRPVADGEVAKCIEGLRLVVNYLAKGSWKCGQVSKAADLLESLAAENAAYREAWAQARAEMCEKVEFWVKALGARSTTAAIVQTDIAILDRLNPDQGAQGHE